jgi:hypothetical protein
MLSSLALSGRATLGGRTRLALRSLFALLNKVGRATVNLPAPDEVVHDAQDKDESEDGAGPVENVTVSFISARVADRINTDQFMSAGPVPLKIGKKLMRVDMIE